MLQQQRAKSIGIDNLVKNLIKNRKSSSKSPTDDINSNTLDTNTAIEQL